MFILVVEDDFHTRRAIEIILRTEGHAVEVADSGLDALGFAREFQPDVMVLDLMLTDISGYDVLSRLRAAKSTLPVIVLSAMCGVEDKVKAFRAGADDYLTKPFHRDELVARIRAVTRRARGQAEDVIRVGDLEIDSQRGFARIGQSYPPLSRREFQLLELLCAREGVIVTRATIMDKLYGANDHLPEPKIIDVLICNIRRKLARVSGGVNYLETIWGRGFRARAGCPPASGRVDGTTVDALAEARAYDAANAGRAA